MNEKPSPLSWLDAVLIPHQAGQMVAYQPVHEMRQWIGCHPHHRNRFGGQVQEELRGSGGAHRLRHRGSDFTHHRIADQDRNGSYNNIDLMGAMANGAFPGRTPVGARFHHLAGGNGVGSKGPDFHIFPVNLPNFPYNAGTNACAVAVYDCYTNQEFTLPGDLYQLPTK
jgi:hypothetical protein